MRVFTFVPVLRGGKPLPAVKAKGLTQQAAHSAAWETLTENQKNNLECLDFVEVEREYLVNQIVEVKMVLQDNGCWQVEVKKEFALEHGGGDQTFTATVGDNVHFAIDEARRMVTVTPGQRQNSTI